MFEEGPSAKIGAVVFVAVLGLGLGLILAVPRLVAAWCRDDREQELVAAPDISDPPPALVIETGNDSGKARADTNDKARANGKGKSGRQDGSSRGDGGRKGGGRKGGARKDGAARIPQRQR
jgi:uncharacterized membrane protein YgcG